MEGDDGATDQDDLEVNGYASTPYDVAVGGTDFDTLGINLPQYLNSTNTGNSPTQASVTGYIPENPWNDSIINNPPGDYDANVAGIYGNGAIVAGGGGGASYAAYCSGTIDPTTGDCDGSYGGYPTPAFQQGISVTPDAQSGVRYLPDVSMFAGTNQQYPSTWALCSDSAVAQAPSGETFNDCQPDSSGNFTVETAGGTAASSAAFAGVLGMVSQSLGGARLGQADTVLYNLYALYQQNPDDSPFHDVTAGNNSEPCFSGVHCGSNNFLLGYNATSGYDLASGLGRRGYQQARRRLASIQPDSDRDHAQRNSHLDRTRPSLSRSAPPSPLLLQRGPSRLQAIPAREGLDAREQIPLNNGPGF